MQNRLYILFLFVIQIALCLFYSGGVYAEDPSHTLNIEIQDKGTAVIHARIELQTAPDQAFKILTDYDQWPTLFPEGFHIHITDCSGNCSVIADMVIPHALVSWTTHLRARSQEYPPHTFELHLVDGDYLQYQLKWEFAPAQEAESTHATMNLVVQPKGWLAEWTPDFLYEWTIRKGLEDHFTRFQQQAILRSANSFPTKP